MKGKVQIIAGAFSLVALLTYTLVHTGGLLSAYVRPEFVGYVAAFGIELAIVSLSLRIGELRKANQNVGFFLLVLVSVVVVSAIANIEGFAVSTGQRLTLLTVQNLDALQAIIGLAATGLISLIVLALSEIVGSDVSLAANERARAVKLAERKLSTPVTTVAPSVQSTVVIDAQPDTLTQARGVKGEQDAEQKAQRVDKLLSLCVGNPDIGVTELSNQLGISRTAVYTYVKEVTEAGRLTKNGKGWEVLTVGSIDSMPVATVDTAPAVN